MRGNGGGVVVVGWGGVGAAATTAAAECPCSRCDGTARAPLVLLWTAAAVCAAQLNRLLPARLPCPPPFSSLVPLRTVVQQQQPTDPPPPPPPRPPHVVLLQTELQYGYAERLYDSRGGSDRCASCVGLGWLGYESSVLPPARRVMPPIKGPCC